MVVCPYCKREFDANEIIKGTIGTGIYAYSCPYCSTLLQITELS